MKTQITIDLNEDRLTICERGCLVEECTVSEDWPIVIYEITERLRDYLEGLQ